MDIAHRYEPSIHSVKMARCAICDKKFNLGEKVAVIYEEDFCSVQVHANGCLDEYMKLLKDPKEISRGAIIGVCDYCAKPVRIKDPICIRRAEQTDPSGSKECDDTFLTTIPLTKNIGFTHKSCYEIHEIELANTAEDEIGDEMCE